MSDGDNSDLYERRLKTAESIFEWAGRALGNCKEIPRSDSEAWRADGDLWWLRLSPDPDNPDLIPHECVIGLRFVPGSDEVWRLQFESTVFSPADADDEEEAELPASMPGGSQNTDDIVVPEQIVPRFGVYDISSDSMLFKRVFDSPEEAAQAVSQHLQLSGVSAVMPSQDMMVIGFAAPRPERGLYLGIDAIKPD